MKLLKEQLDELVEEAKDDWRVAEAANTEDSGIIPVVDTPIDDQRPQNTRDR